jgi:hypothetical protein
VRLAAAIILILSAVASAQQQQKLERYEGRYYIIHTDLAGDDLREAELRMAKMAEEYHDRTKDFSGDISDKLPFFLFRREADYLAAGGAERTAGFFDPASNTLMAVAGEELSRETWSVVQHEGFHQFARAVIGGKLPVWVNEGLAEYFGEGVFTGDGFVTGVIPAARLRRIRDEMRNGEFKPIRDIMFLPHGQWNREMSIVNYDQAWSMVQFLAHGEGGKYQAAFGGFMRAIGSGQQWERAWLNNFGSAEGFEQKWKAYWMRLPENPTAGLYARATLQTITGVYARATAQKQSYPSFDELLKAVGRSEIRIDDRDWLPPMLIRSSFSRAVAMREQGGNFTLTPAKGNKPATIVCALKDGTRLTGRFTIEAGRVTDVVIDPPVGK